MRFWNLGRTLALAALLAWPLASSVTYAQRGDRGGGDRGGRSGSGERGGGGARGGGPRGGGEFRSGGGGGDRGSRSGGSRQFSGRSQPSGGGERAGGGQTTRTFQGERSRGPQSGDRDGGAESQRSFYRGPNTSRESGDRNASGRNSGSRDAGGRNAWPDNGNRDREGDDRDRHNANRGDRDRWDDNNRNWNGDRDNRNRSDWDRFTRDAFGVGRGGYGYRGDDIRRNWWRGYNYNRNNVPFQYGWLSGYYGGAGWPIYSPYRYSRWSNRPNYWWGYTPATALTNYVVFGFDRPRYWSYGPGANIYYQDDYVYYDNKRTIPVSTYYQQIYDLAHSVPNISQSEAENMDWKPLGVFAVGRDGESLSQRALQLAINKDGVITGTYFSRDKDEVHPVSGMVDERTQRAAWAFADGTQNDVVFETALYNLTRQESTMMVHFGPASGDTQVWQLVRLEQPETASAQQSSQPTRSLP